MKNNTTNRHGAQTIAIHAGEPPRHGVGAPVGTSEKRKRKSAVARRKRRKAMRRLQGSDER